MTPRRLFIAIVGLNLLAILLVLGFWLIPNSARFTIDAVVERFVMTVPSGQRPPAWGDIALVAADDQPELSGCAKPMLALAPQARQPLTITVSRVGDTLETALSVDAGSLGMLKCGGDVARAAGSYAVAQFPLSKAPTLMLDGQLVLGDEIADNGQSAKLLREGHIDVEARSWPFTTGMARSTTALMLGDQVQIYARDGDAPVAAIVKGLARADGDAIRVVGYATAVNAQVMRAGQARSAPIVIAPTFLARLQSQAEWAIVAVVATLLLNALAATAKVLELGSGMKPDDD